MEKIKTILKKESSLISLIILFFLASILFSSFANKDNLLNVVRDISIYGLISIGMTLVIISGGIDLSVGSVFALSSVFLAYFATSMNGYLAIILTLVLMLFFGLLMGALIAKGKLEPFIVTLAGLMFARGLAYIVSNEQTVKIESQPNEILAQLGRMEVLGLPLSLYIFVIIVIIFSIIMAKTKFGRTIYAIGSNEDGAKIMGLKVERTKILVYGLSSLLAGLSGILLASKLGTGQPNSGTGYELTAILSVVIGGALITGGVGKVRGSVVGIIILTLIDNIFNLNGIGTFYRNIILGAILLIIVIMQNRMKKEK